MEQMDDKPFNRAKLFNVGVKEGVMKMEVEKAQKCNAQRAELLSGIVI